MTEKAFKEERKELFDSDNRLAKAANASAHRILSIASAIVLTLEALGVSDVGVVASALAGTYLIMHVVKNLTVVMFLRLGLEQLIAQGDASLQERMEGLDKNRYRYHKMNKIYDFVLAVQGFVGVTALITAVIGIVGG